MQTNFFHKITWSGAQEKQKTLSDMEWLHITVKKQRIMNRQDPAQAYD